MILIGIFALEAGAAPVKKDRKYYEARGEIVWEVPTNEKLIAITFDDGPDPKYTPLILDLLDQYNAKSTFFAVGSRATQFPELAQRIANEGHELSNHTFSHLYLRGNVATDQYLNDIMKTQNIIAELTGTYPRLFRPPGGYYNEKIVHIAKQAGIQIILWSWHQDTKDWKRPGPQVIASNVLKNIKNGDIVLMHDHVRLSQTVDALKLILPELEERGYKLVTVSELLSHYKVFENR